MNENISNILLLSLPLSNIRAVDNESHAIKNHNVEIGEDYASFNGKNSYLEIAHNERLDFGNEDFSILMQIWIDEHVGGVVGDIVSKYDPVNRRGFHLSVKDHAGAVTSQTNFRNLHFEADDACAREWNDFGKVGNAVAVWSLAVHRGELYAGTYEQAANESGRIYRYLGNQQWKCCGPLDGSNTAIALTVFEDNLYAATKTEDPHGSLLKPTPNQKPGGNVYRLNCDETWTHCGKVCDQNNIFGMAVFRDRLYAWPAYAKGVYRYEGGTEWRKINSPDSRLMTMAPYHGNLYAAANRLALLDPNVTHAGPNGDPRVQAIVGKDGVYRLDERGNWIGCGNQANETQIYSIGIHEGKMYVGTWPSGKVFRYDGDRHWHDCGRLGNEDEVMGMAIYNGKLYACALPSASIYRYDGESQWTCVGQADDTLDVPLKRAINMAVYRGQLCVGTLPSGRVRALQVGQVASYDWPLPAGWHDIACVRRKGVLELYLDGKQVAQSNALPNSLNLSNKQPLRVGFGAQDCFHGRMRELRIYQGALSAHEISASSDASSQQFVESRL